MGIAHKYISYLDRKLQEDENLATADETSILDTIDTPGLEKEKKMEILSEYIASLEAELVLATTKLKEVTGDPEALPEV